MATIYDYGLSDADVDNYPDDPAPARRSTSAAGSAVSPPTARAARPSLTPGSARRSPPTTSARPIRPDEFADLMAAFGVTVETWELRLADGRVVEQRGFSGVDAAQRHHKATGEVATGFRKKAQP